MLILLGESRDSKTVQCIHRAYILVHSLQSISGQAVSQKQRAKRPVHAPNGKEAVGVLGLGASPPHLVAWPSLVSRSIAAWDDLATNEQTTRKDFPKSMLEECHSLDDFLVQSGKPLMLWFFQQRSAFMSQKRMKKWSRDELDDYILLPASPGFITRHNCFFVSHFWRTQDHPNPDGEYLRLH